MLFVLGGCGQRKVVCFGAAARDVLGLWFEGYMRPGPFCGLCVIWGETGSREEEQDSSSIIVAFTR